MGGGPAEQSEGLFLSCGGVGIQSSKLRIPDPACSAIIRLGLLDDPLKKAADTVGNIIIGAKSAEVTPIRGKDGAA